MLRVLRCERWDDPAWLIPTWNHLLAQSTADTVFLTHEWLTAWWEAYGAGRELLLLLVLDGETLVGIVPLYRAPLRALGVPLRVLRLVGEGSFDSDHLDLIARADRTGDVVRASVDWLEQHRAEWDLLELGPVDASSPTLRSLQAELVSRGWAQTTREEQHGVIELPATWEVYLASLSTKMRGNVRRATRELTKNHTVHYRRCSSEEELPVFLDCLYQMHAERWKQRGEPGSFADSRRRALYARIGRDFLERGWLRFWLLEVDGEPVAAEFGFRYGATHSFLQSGFSMAHAHQSVGVVLKSHILQVLIRRGGMRYDFLGGNDAYKHRWGPVLVPHLQMICARPRSAGAVFLGTRRALDGAKAWLREAVPPTVAEPLRRGYRKLRPRRDDPTQ